MHGSKSPLFRVGLRTDSSWYTVNVSTWTWEEGNTEKQAYYFKDITDMLSWLRPCVHAYLVALDQDSLHLFEQVLQEPAAQRLHDLHQGSPRHVTDLLEAVPQQHTHLDQDPG